MKLVEVAVTVGSQNGGAMVGIVVGLNLHLVARLGGVVVDKLVLGRVGGRC